MNPQLLEMPVTIVLAITAYAAWRGTRHARKNGSRKNVGQYGAAGVYAPASPAVRRREKQYTPDPGIPV